MLLRTVWFVALCFGMLAQGAAVSLAAQDGAQQAVAGSTTYEGVKVQKITFPGAFSAKDQAEFLGFVDQRIGEPLDRNLIRKSIQNLYGTGRFKDIQVQANPAGNGEIAVAFVTIPNMFIGRVDVNGTPDRPTASQVVNASKLQLGAIFTQDKVDKALKNIQQLMETNGFYHSTTEADEETDPVIQQTNIVLQVHPGPQARVGKVTMTGDLVHSQEELEDLAKFHPGNLVTVKRVSDALDRLRKKFHKKNLWLAQISVAERVYRPEKNVVDYKFILQRGAIVTINADGFRLERSVLRRNVPVYEENAADDDLLNEGRRNLLNHMQSLGYYNAKVTLDKDASADGTQLHVIYHIDSGPRYKLVAVLLQGNKYFADELLRTRLQIQPADRFVYPRGHFSQGLLTSDMHGVENLYQSAGFRNVKVTSRVESDYKSVENQLAVHLDVEEGAQTLVQTLIITGEPEQAKEASPSLNIGPGQPFAENNIASDRDILLNYYFNSGFPNATFQASATPLPGSNDRMNVTYTINAGNQVFVNQVLVAGLVHTRSYIAQRELEVKTGDPLGQISILKTQQNLYDLGIFSQVDTAVQNPDGTEPSKNVLVSLHEAKRYTFTYGVGFEFQTGQPTVGNNQPLGQTGVSPLVAFEVTRLNFLGRNHTISFKANVGRLQQRGLLSYRAPRLLGSRKWQLTLTSFYDNTVDVTTFTSQRLEGSIQAEDSVSKSTQINYRFAFRRVKASQIEISQDLIPLLSQPVRVGGPGISYIRNQRDNDLESTKGSYNTIDASVAAGAFGSESNFSRILAQNSTYYALGKRRQTNRRFVLARSTRIGVETPFAGTVTLPPSQTCPDPAQTNCPGLTLIPLAERFLSGGGNSIRGFGLNQAGPRDPQTGFPLGGSALFINNIELRFPARNFPYVQDNLGFAIFEDAGNVFTDGRTMLDNLLRWRQKNPAQCLQAATANQCDYSYVSHAIGLGIRYKTPVGPVSFDFGYNLNPPSFPSCQASPGSTGGGVSSYCTADPGSPYFVPQQASHFNVFFSIGQSF